MECHFNRIRLENGQIYHVRLSDESIIYKYIMGHNPSDKRTQIYYIAEYGNRITTLIHRNMKQELKNYFLDPSLDYRRELSQYKVNLRGDLLIRENNRWECLISRERLTEPDWIAHLCGRLSNRQLGEFVCAYMKALERLGVKSLNTAIYGFDTACKYADGK